MEVTAQLTTLDVVAKWAKMPDHDTRCSSNSFVLLAKESLANVGMLTQEEVTNLIKDVKIDTKCSEPLVLLEGMRPCIAPRVSGTEQPSEEFDSSPRRFRSAFQLAPSVRCFCTYAACTLELERLP